MTTTTVILVRRFDDLNLNPKVFRMRRSAIGTAAASGYVPLDPPVIQHKAGTPFHVAEPVGVGGRVAVRSGPITLPEK